MNLIGQRIKKLRKIHGITQSDVADYIGVQRVSVSKWESQSDVHNTPKGEHLFKLCQFLGTTAEYLLYGSSDFQKPQFSHLNSTEINESEAQYLGTPSIITWQQIDLIKETRIYALPVVGDSMVTTKGPYNFPDGTLILFDPSWSGDLLDGIFILAQVGGDYLLRQIKFDGTKPYLNALNAQYPKIFESFEVVGKVTEMQIKLP